MDYKEEHNFGLHLFQEKTFSGNYFQGKWFAVTTHSQENKEKFACTIEWFLLTIYSLLYQTSKIAEKAFLENVLLEMNIALASKMYSDRPILKPRPACCQSDLLETH